VNKQKLIESYDVAFKLHYRITTDALGLAYDPETRYYEFKDLKATSLHLLETVLLGMEDLTGNWIVDVAKILETSPDYIEGFISGLSLNFLMVKRDAFKI
jgi:hypothetical protein